MNFAESKDRIIFALDVSSAQEADRYITLLKGYVGVFKVGLELFVSEGPDIVEKIRAGGHQVFLDLKLFDIPKTVERAMRALAGLDVSFATVHCAGGSEMLQAAVAGAGGNVHVLGVTVLTSAPLDEFGTGRSVSDVVVDRAVLAKESGCSGVVCSGLEVQRVKSACGSECLAVTPGIRPLGQSGQDDQKRVVTASQAVSWGADYIVVGRPIKDAADPQSVAISLAGEMDN